MKITIDKHYADNMRVCELRELKEALSNNFGFDTRKELVNHLSKCACYLGNMISGTHFELDSIDRADAVYDMPTGGPTIFIGCKGHAYTADGYTIFFIYGAMHTAWECSQSLEPDEREALMDRCHIRKFIEV